MDHQVMPHCFKKSRCDEEQGAVRKLARERRFLRDQAGCGLERSSSRMLVLAFVPSTCATAKRTTSASDDVHL